MTSIRRRTTTTLAAALLALLLLAGLALFAILRHALTAQFDDALLARAAALQSLARFDGRKLEFDFSPDALPRFARPAATAGGAGDAEYYVLWKSRPEPPGWELFSRSATLTGESWPGAAAPPLSTARPLARSTDAAPPEPLDLPLPNKRPGRAVLIGFAPALEHDEDAPPLASPQPAPQLRLLVAVSRASLDHTLAAIATAIIAVGAALALASLAIVAWAVRSGLAPVGALSRQVAALGPDTLHDRFQPGPLPAELRPIAEQLSALLARLHEAFEREKRFTAAASHELRTPIAELRTLLEVAASRPRSDAEWRATSQRALAVLASAHALCESLLRLARAEALPHDARATPLPLAPLLARRAEAALAHTGADPRCLRVHCDSSLTDPALAVAADPAALNSIIANLLDNALRHGALSPDRPADCRARLSGDAVELTISNPAPGLSPTHLDRLTEPFWQADHARARRDGSGLGLAVALALSRAINASLRFSLQPPDLLVAALRLPRPDAPPAANADSDGAPPHTTT